ncbi:MAG: S8 family peptidase [Candidatus Sericytochromatia bacterium]
MKNLLKATLLSTLVVFSITSCNRGEIISNTEEQLDTEIPAFSQSEIQSAGKEYNAMGVSKKRFSLFFKSKLNDSTFLQKLEEKYKTKFKKVIPEIGVAVVEKSETDENNQLAGSMKAESTVDSYEPINMVVLEKISADKANDPLINKQYHLDTLNADKAWDISMGDKNVKIAIVDTGIDLNHPDLKDRILKGKNIVNPELKPYDDNGHGTHVAGIAAATANNDIGVAGIAPKCSIIPVKALKYGKGSDIDIAEGIVWAANNGANVINISIGLYTKSTALEKAVKYALSKGVTVVSSAGNESKSSKMHMPSMIKGVIEVSATTKDDKFAPFSNFAQQVSVSAPGDKIFSTMPTYEVELTAKTGKNYGILSGTSMASPVVAGLAALIKSNNPSLSPSKIREKLETTAVNLAKKKYDDKFGYGRVDMFKALSN